MSNQTLFEAALRTFLGALIPIAVYFFQKVYTYLKTRDVRYFWANFIQKPLTIIVTEYPTSGEDRLARIARVAGAGWLISKGMALGMSTLKDFCEKRIINRGTMKVLGDRTGTITTDNLIILGSPANNLLARSIQAKLDEVYDMPYKIIWGEAEVIGISVGSETVFLPEYSDGMGQDYALVVKALYQVVPKKWVLLISGCYMWGTQAGAKAVTDPLILNEVVKLTNRQQNVAFVIRTRIVNNSPLGPEIDINNKRFIKILHSKTQSQED